MQDSPVNVTFALSPYHVPVPLPLIHSVAALQKAVKAIGNTALLFEIIPHCVLKPYCAIGQITTSRNRNTYRSCCNLSYAYVFTVTVGIITCVVEILAYDNIFI